MWIHNLELNQMAHALQWIVSFGHVIMGSFQSEKTHNCANILDYYFKTNFLYSY